MTSQMNIDKPVTGNLACVGYARVLLQQADRLMAGDLPAMGVVSVVVCPDVAKIQAAMDEARAQGASVAQVPAVYDFALAGLEYRQAAAHLRVIAAHLDEMARTAEQGSGPFVHPIGRS